MDRSVLRGALLVLPVLLYSLVDAANNAPIDLYRIFSLPLSEMSKQIVADRNDRVKDLFLARHHLPLARRTFRPVAVAPVTGYGDPERRYLSLYAEFTDKQTVTFLLDGVETGSLSINGEKKGSFSLKDRTGYVEIRITFAPGVYAMLFSLDRTDPALPPLLLADRTITPSTRGFTRTFSATASIAVRSLRDGVVYRRLWRTRCIPAPQDSRDDRLRWEQAYGSPDAPFTYDPDLPLIVLLRHADDRTTREALLKAGFDERSLDLWKEWFTYEGRCRDAAVP